MADKILLPDEDDIFTYPMLEHILDVNTNEAERRGAILAAIKDYGSHREAIVRVPMTDRAAMQLLHLLQRYASARGLSPVNKPGPETALS